MHQIDGNDTSSEEDILDAIKKSPGFMLPENPHPRADPVDGGGSALRADYRELNWGELEGRPLDSTSEAELRADGMLDIELVQFVHSMYASGGLPVKIGGRGVLKSASAEMMSHLKEVCAFKAHTDTHIVYQDESVTILWGVKANSTFFGETLARR